MQEQSGAVKHRGGPGFLRYIPVKIILTIAILAAVFGAGVGVRSVLVSGNKLTRLGFEDIGELATQAAYCTEVNVTEGARELFGLTAIRPFQDWLERMGFVENGRLTELAGDASVLLA